MSIGLIIFDCDGVLIDSEVIACRVVADCLTAAGFPTQANAIVEFVGTSSGAMYATLEARFGRGLPDGLDRTIRAALLRAFETELRPMPGIGALLTDVDDVRRCVASSSHPDRLEHSLRLAGLFDDFAPNIFSATLVPRGKPAPDLFLHAAAAMDVELPRCLVVEDSVPGVQAATAASMRVIGFTAGAHCRPGHAERLRAAGASAIAGSMAELGSMLRKLMRR
jgi:HAD superfamily hydrolase (TIGR01509 family)